MFLTLATALLAGTASLSAETEWPAPRTLFGPPPSASSPAPSALLFGDSPFRYSYVEVGAATLNVEPFDDDPEVYYAEASLALGPFHVVAGYENSKIELGNSTNDLLSLGVGAHLNLARDFDVTGDIRWLYSDVDSGIAGLDDSHTGYEVRVGPRILVLPWPTGGIELNGRVSWTDLEGQFASDDKLFAWAAGARVHFLRLLSVGAEYGRNEEGDERVAANARLSF